MKLLYIHTCRTAGVFLERMNGTILPGPESPPAIQTLQRYNNQFNYLKHVESCIEKHKNYDIFSVEFSTLKYDEQSTIYNKNQYETYLRNLMKILKDRPIFILFNFNQIISEVDITPELKKKMNPLNRVIDRDNLERWTTQIFKKYYRGICTMTTGEEIYGKYNESRYLNKYTKPTKANPKPLLDLNHFKYNVLDNGMTPKKMFSKLVHNKAKDFIQHILNNSHEK